MRKWFVIFALCWFCLSASVQAQAPVPLNGPLVAVNTAAQDRIIVVDVSSGATRPLKLGTGSLMPWGFAADGCRIVYTSSDGLSLGRVYSSKLDGSDSRSLVQFNELPDDAWGVWEPQVSPDGTTIAFSLLRRDAQSGKTTGHIAVVDANGGTPKIYSVSGSEYEPRWSPDGKWLAYISFTERVPGADINSTAVPTPQGQEAVAGTLLREADLWVVSADAKTKYRLTDFATGSVRAPRWSPDGFLLSFIYSPSPNNDTFWMIGNADGAIPTELSYQWSAIMDTTWFPDSASILGVARDFQKITDNTLWRVPLVGNADTDATQYLADPNLSFVDYPRFSADGQWLALRSEYALALVNVSTNQWSLAANVPLANTPPVWSPAGFRGENQCPQ